MSSSWGHLRLNERIQTHLYNKSLSAYIGLSSESAVQDEFDILSVNICSGHEAF